MQNKKNHVFYKKTEEEVKGNGEYVLAYENFMVVLERKYMSKEEICEKVRSICKKENVEFLFITEGKSCWSVSKNEHIRKVAHFHKENENKCATDRAEVE